MPIFPHPPTTPPWPTLSHPSLQSKRLHHVLYLDGEEEWLDLSNEMVVWARAMRGSALSAGHFLSSEFDGEGGCCGWLTRHSWWWGHLPLQGIQGSVWEVPGFAMYCRSDLVSNNLIVPAAHSALDTSCQASFLQQHMVVGGRARR
jgi:hypothetical protein